MVQMQNPGFLEMLQGPQQVNVTHTQGSACMQSSLPQYSGNLFYVIFHVLFSYSLFFFRAHFSYYFVLFSYNFLYDFVLFSYYFFIQLYKNIIKFYIRYDYNFLKIFLSNITENIQDNFLDTILDASEVARTNVTPTQNILETAAALSGVPHQISMPSSVTPSPIAQIKPTQAGKSEESQDSSPDSGSSDKDGRSDEEVAVDSSQQIHLHGDG